MQQSRLSRRKENQSKKSFFLSLLGIIVVIFFLIKIGIPSLVNLTLLISGAKGASETTKEKNIFLSAPLLETLPSATNSGKIAIKGTGTPKAIAKLYINSNDIDQIEINEDGTFIFDDVKLAKGENKIKVKSQEESKESNFSAEYTILFIDTPPSLAIDSPQDGKTFAKDENPITISGKTDAGVKLTINDFWAIVKEDGSFSYSLSLKQGENEIKIAATDLAGNKTEVVKKVTYTP